jgi:primosomal protein N' (replication factor Y)
MESHPLYCDVSLPVPLDQVFTYALPETLRHRVKIGSRVLAPFGTRKLAGIVLRTHHDRPDSPPRELLRLLDEEPVLDGELLKLGHWISSYYCAPLGEVLRSMTPLAADIRRGKIFSLTKSGRDAARQLHLNDTDAEDPAGKILHLLDTRAMSASYLTQKVSKAAVVLRSLEKKGFVEVEDVAAERDPLRASAARLRAEFIRRPVDEKLPKPERELLSYLELHPGSHNIAEVQKSVAKASTSARALARRELVKLTLEAVAGSQFPFRAPHQLKPINR